MDAETLSTNSVSITPVLPLVTTGIGTLLAPVMPQLKPLELWAFLENSDFVRYKDNVPYRQDEVALI